MSPLLSLLTSLGGFQPRDSFERYKGLPLFVEQPRITVEYRSVSFFYISKFLF